MLNVTDCRRWKWIFHLENRWPQSGYSWPFIAFRIWLIKWRRNGTKDQMLFLKKSDYDDDIHVVMQLLLETLEIYNWKAVQLWMLRKSSEKITMFSTMYVLYELAFQWIHITWNEQDAKALYNTPRTMSYFRQQNVQMKFYFQTQIYFLNF